MADDHPSGLDDPASAAFAWARFRRIMIWMALAIAVIDTVAIWIIDHFYGPLFWLTIIATALGFGLTMLLAAALMGLSFMSAGTGHDEAVKDFAQKREDRNRH